MTVPTQCRDGQKSNLAAYNVSPVVFAMTLSIVHPVVRLSETRLSRQLDMLSE